MGCVKILPGFEGGLEPSKNKLVKVNIEGRKYHFLGGKRV
jgi:hypothetical protein